MNIFLTTLPGSERKSWAPRDSVESEGSPNSLNSMCITEESAEYPRFEAHGANIMSLPVSRLNLEGMCHLKKYIMKVLLPVIGTGSQFMEHFSQELLLLSKLFSATDKAHYNLLDSCEGMAGEHFAMIQQWKINSDYIAVLATIPRLSKPLLIPLTWGDTSYSLCKTPIQILSLKLNEDL